MAGSLWGTGFYFGKLALREMSVGHMVLYRFLFATLGMLPILVAGRAARLVAGPTLPVAVAVAVAGERASGCRDPFGFQSLSLYLCPLDELIEI